MAKKTVMIIDGGGRGAALVASYAKSPQVGKIIAVPGNDTMWMNSKIPVLIFPDLTTTSVRDIVDIAKHEKVDLADVAQDNAVAAGVADALRKAGITTIGPSKRAGQIEWDKLWARDFGRKYTLPQPNFYVVRSVAQAKKLLEGKPDVIRWIKAAGLAEGKGAVKAETVAQALSHVAALQKKFPEAARTILIEDHMEGEEFSAFAITDGKTYKLLGFAQDHKRVFDGDKGDNTGGMGCSTPPLVVTKKVKEQVEDIFEKTVSGLQKENRQYNGILYLGVMVTNNQTVQVVEFNARWGDPEAQTLLPGLKSDLYEVSTAVAREKLSKTSIVFDKKSRVCITGASKGYPNDYKAVKSKQIKDIEHILKQKGITFFGAGIKQDNGKYFTNGGRLFYIVGEGKTVIEAREKAYNAMKLISIEGDNLHFRTDIGWRDVERLKTLLNS